MTAPSAAVAIVRHGEALSTLARLLEEASGWQFSAPPRRSRGLDEARPSGRVSDPTANVATSEPRLALRAALADSASAIGSATVFVESATEALERALAPYVGDRPLDDLVEVTEAADRVEALLTPAGAARAAPPIPYRPFERTAP